MICKLYLNKANFLKTGSIIAIPTLGGIFYEILLNEKKKIQRNVYFYIFLKILFIYFQRDGKGGRKRGETSTAASRAPPAGDPDCHPGM